MSIAEEWEAEVSEKTRTLLAYNQLIPTFKGDELKGYRNSDSFYMDEVACLETANAYIEASIFLQRRRHATIKAAINGE